MISLCIGCLRGDELREWISRDTFTEMTQPLMGLPVSWTWRGYGSAIFLEFGNLIEEKPQNESNIHISRRGEIGCMIEGSWRVERPRSILFGSDDGKRKIENGLVKLRESHVVQISIEGRLPEIAFELTGGYWVRSFMSWGWTT